MSDYLAKFQAITRRRADPELIRRWESSVRYYGDANIKIQLANAKRTSTSMTKAGKQFSNLRPEHELAINAAVSAMQALVRELEPLALWAKDYKVFCDAERKKEVAAELDAIAMARWGNDEGALQFEVDLIAELGTLEGRLAFAKWVHATGKYLDVAMTQITCTVNALNYHGSTVRERAANTVKEEMRSTTPNRWNDQRGPKIICPWQDYEAYVAYRREVAKTTARIVQMANENGL